MPESVYDVIELVGASKESWEKAAANAVEQASKSLRDVRVAEIVKAPICSGFRAGLIGGIIGAWSGHRRSPLPRCAPRAFGGFWSIAPTTGAAITSLSAAISGKTMFGCLILSRGSFACGKRGADVRPDFHRDKPGTLTRGY
jgi:flavin-binding protein dodecin